MKLSDFNYTLQKELIAQKPIFPRDHSRLLVINKKNGKIQHHTFYDIINFLNPGDILVLNNSKVIKARLIGQKRLTHGKVEILLHREMNPGEWEVIGKNLKIGLEIIFSNSPITAFVVRKKEETFILRFNLSGEDFFKEIDKIGLVPLPPYIRREKALKSDDGQYQTVFSKNRGSVAAPTAGLHFTKELLKKIEEKNIKIAYVTLHVGLGTFTPVTAEDVLSHKMHPEYYTVTLEELKKIVTTKKEGRRVVAVGTTTTRVLETIFRDSNTGDRRPEYKSRTSDYELRTTNLSGWTDIFIYPGYRFKCVDCLITNFHLPKSTLLMLVSAFAGKKNIDRAYQEAIKQKYRFYSYGDAMLII